MDKFYSILSTLPFFLITTKRENGTIGERSIHFNWPDFIRVVIVAVLGAVATTIITVRVLSVELGNLKEQNKQITEKLEQLGCKLSDMSERMAIVETRQAERIERERAMGIRK